MPLRRATKIAHALMVDTRCLEWTLAGILTGWGIFLALLVNAEWTPVFLKMMDGEKGLGFFRFAIIPLLATRVVSILARGQRGRKWAAIFEAVYWYLVFWILVSKGAILWQTISSLVFFFANLFLIVQKALVQPKTAEDPKEQAGGINGDPRGD